MADTKRSLSDIITLLADNAAGDISAQDIRDMVVTLQPDYGTIYVTTPAATAISDSVSFFQANGTYALVPTSVDWDMAVPGQLRYVGTASRLVRVWSSVSITSAGSNQLTEMSILKNGTSVDSTVIQRKIGTGTDVGAVACMGCVGVDPGDHLAVGIKNLTSTADVTCENLNLFTIGLAV